MTGWPASRDTSLTGCVDSRALDRVGIDRRKSGVVRLAGTDADHSLDRLHEDLPVAYLTSAGRRENGLHARLDEWLGTHHFDLHFLVELHDDRRAAILLEPLVLPPVSTDAAQCDAGDPGSEQRRLDFGDAVGAYDRRDELHAGLPVDWGWATGSIAAAAGGAIFRISGRYASHCERIIRARGLPVLWKCCWINLRSTRSSIELSPPTATISRLQRDSSKPRSSST